MTQTAVPASGLLFAKELLATGRDVFGGTPNTATETVALLEARGDR